MKLLLDTHTFLWFTGNHPQLSTTARDLLEDGDNDLWLSVVSLWEIAIKMSIGKLALKRDFASLIPEEMAANGIQRLTMELPHLSTLIALPLHHRDPFDRLIIAQAMAENLPIVSIDAKFDAYPVKRLW